MKVSSHRRPIINAAKTLQELGALSARVTLKDGTLWDYRAGRMHQAIGEFAWTRQATNRGDFNGLNPEAVRGRLIQSGIASALVLDRGGRTWDFRDLNPELQRTKLPKSFVYVPFSSLYPEVGRQYLEQFPGTRAVKFSAPTEGYIGDWCAVTNIPTAHLPSPLLAYELHMVIDPILVDSPEELIGFAKDIRDLQPGLGQSYEVFRREIKARKSEFYLLAQDALEKVEDWDWDSTTTLDRIGLVELLEQASKASPRLRELRPEKLAEALTAVKGDAAQLRSELLALASATSEPEIEQASP